jgi:putative transposase
VRAPKPDTILAWYRRLIARKFDGSKFRSYPGRPRISREVTDLIVQMARENSGWATTASLELWRTWATEFPIKRWATRCANTALHQRRKRSQTTTWKDFIRSHMDVLTGVDFFTIEVLTWKGLATYYVLLFIHLESRRVSIAGVTRHPTEAWMEQMARNATDETSGCLRQLRYILHDRDTKFCTSFRSILTTGGVQALTLPPRSPNLNAFAERWVRSVKQECLSKLILFGEGSLKRALNEFDQHYHSERNHQGKDNVLLFPYPDEMKDPPNGSVCCRERLGGLLRYYCRAA